MRMASRQKLDMGVSLPVLKKQWPKRAASEEAVSFLQANRLVGSFAHLDTVLHILCDNDYDWQRFAEEGGIQNFEINLLLPYVHIGPAQADLRASSRRFGREGRVPNGPIWRFQVVLTRRICCSTRRICSYT